MHVRFEKYIVTPGASGTGFTVNPRDDGSVVLVIQDNGDRVIIQGPPNEITVLGTALIQNAAVSGFVSAQKAMAKRAAAGIPAADGNGSAPKPNLG